MECAFMLKIMECAQGKKMRKVNIYTKYTELQNTRIYRNWFWISEMLQKFIIVYFYYVGDVSLVSI